MQKGLICQFIEILTTQRIFLYKHILYVDFLFVFRCNTVLTLALQAAGEAVLQSLADRQRLRLLDSSLVTALALPQLSRRDSISPLRSVLTSSRFVWSTPNGNIPGEQIARTLEWSSVGALPSHLSQPSSLGLHRSRQASCQDSTFYHRSTSPSSSKEQHRHKFSSSCSNSSSSISLKERKATLSSLHHRLRTNCELHSWLHRIRRCLEAFTSRRPRQAPVMIRPVRQRYQRKDIQEMMCLYRIAGGGRRVVTRDERFPRKGGGSYPKGSNRWVKPH